MNDTRINRNGRPKRGESKKQLMLREFFKNFFEDPDYRERLKLRINRGKAMPIEVLGYHYAYGKPPAVIEVPPPKGIPLVELVDQITKDEMRVLAAMARRLKAVSAQMLDNKQDGAHPTLKAP